MTQPPRRARAWLFTAAAAIPCCLLLVFSAIGINEWWLISTNQIAVIPVPKPGMTSVPNMPAANALPLALGAGAFAAIFGAAWWRGSRALLGSGYLALVLVIGAAVVRRML